MRISTGEMAKMILQTLQGAKDVSGQLELKVGTVVRATLLEFLDNKSEAWLMIGNTKVRAQVDAELQPGDQLELLVTGEQKRGAMELKLVGQTARGDAGKAMQLDLAGILQALQLPEGDDIKALVQELLSRNLNLNADALKQGAQVLRATSGTPTQAQVATLGKMIELGIPMTPSTFQAMNALDNGPRLHQLLERVASALQDLVPETPSGASGQTTSGTGTTGASQGGANTSGAGAGNTGQTAVNAGASSASGQNQSMSGTTGTQSSVADGGRAGAQSSPANVGTSGTPAQGAGATTTPSLGSLTGAASAGSAGSAGSAVQAGDSQATGQPASLANSASVQTPSASTTGSRLNHADAQARNASQVSANGNAEQLSAKGRVSDGSPALTSQARESLHQLSKAIHDLVSDQSASADSLHDKAKQLGLALEDRLGAALRRLPADSDATTVRDAVQIALRNLASEAQGAGLKEALLHVQRSSSELSAAGHAALADDVGALLNNLSGQQLMSTPGQTGQRTDLFYQFTAVPLQMNGRQQTVELHVMSRKGPGQKNLDPANCYILFRLEMPNLGELDIHLHIVDRVVGVRFVSEDRETVQIDGADQRELREKLQGVGYHLGIMKVEEKLPVEEGKRLPLLPPLLTQGGLDLRM